LRYTPIPFVVGTAISVLGTTKLSLSSSPLAATLLALGSGIGPVIVSAGALLTTFNEAPTLIILMNLQARGMTGTEIAGLINFAGRWNEQYPAGRNGKDMGANNGGGSKLYTCSLV